MLLLQQRRETTHQTSNLAELQQLGADDDEDVAAGRHASGAELLRGAPTQPKASLNDQASPLFSMRLTPAPTLVPHTQLGVAFNNTLITHLLTLPAHASGAAAGNKHLHKEKWMFQLAKSSRNSCWLKQAPAAGISQYSR